MRIGRGLGRGVEVQDESQADRNEMIIVTDQRKIVTTTAAREKIESTVTNIHRRPHGVTIETVIEMAIAAVTTMMIDATKIVIAVTVPIRSTTNTETATDILTTTIIGRDQIATTQTNVSIAVTKMIVIRISVVSVMSIGTVITAVGGVTKSLIASDRGWPTKAGACFASFYSNAMYITINPFHAHVADRQL